MKIICLGDSFTEGFLVDKSYTDYLTEKGHNIINLGINGDITTSMADRFRPESSDILMIFGGTNDFYQGIAVDTAIANIKNIIGKSKSKRNFVVIPPYLEEDDFYPRYEYINNTIDKFAKEIKKIDATVIDSRLIEPSYIDGIHMRESFHQKLAELIIENL